MNSEVSYEDAWPTYFLINSTGPCVCKWGLYALPLFPDVIIRASCWRMSPDETQPTGRGIRRLVSLFGPVSAIVYEFDRRNKMTEDGLEEPEVDPTDHRAVAAQKE